MQGALIAVPVVNLFGFVGLCALPARPAGPEPLVSRDRPPDRSPRRIAHIFLKEVVDNATHGIDLHTGAAHRANLPQVRACLDDEETRALAHAFGVPVLLNANVRDGSLRQAVVDRDIPMLVYEGGEALRFDEKAIRAGVSGVFSVMRAPRDAAAARANSPRPEPFVAQLEPLGARAAVGHPALSRAARRSRESGRAARA